MIQTRSHGLRGSEIRLPTNFISFPFKILVQFSFPRIPWVNMFLSCQPPLPIDLFFQRLNLA